MALLQIKAEKMTPKTEYKEGTYLAQIDSVETGTTQSGKMYYAFKLRGDGFDVYTYRIYDSVYGRQDLFVLLSCCGIDPKREDIDTDELLGRFFTIKLEKRRNANGELELYNDKVQWDITEITSAENVESDDDEDFDDWDA